MLYVKISQEIKEKRDDVDVYIYFIALARSYITSINFMHANSFDCKMAFVFIGLFSGEGCLANLFTK